MKFKVLIALFGIASAQTFLTEETDDKPAAAPVLPTFQRSLMEIPQNMRTNIQVLTGALKDIYNLKHAWLFDGTSKAYMQGNTAIRQDSKLIGFDIANLIKDIELMVNSTLENLGRLQRRFDMRAKYQQKFVEKPEMDIKIWSMIYKQLTNDLSYQVDKIEEHLTNLTDIGNKADDVQKQFKVQMGVKEQAIKDVVSRIQPALMQIQAQIDRLNCGITDSEISFTDQCVEARSLRINQNRQQADMFTANEPQRTQLKYYIDQTQLIDQIVEKTNVGKHNFKDKTDENVAMVETLRDSTTDLGSIETRNEIDSALQKDVNSVKAYLTSTESDLQQMKKDLDQRLIYGS